MKKTSKQDKEKLLTLARQRAKHAQGAWDHNFERMDLDIQMLDGDQWPERVKSEREDGGRPCLTFNKLPSYVDQVVGDQKQTSPAINVFPVETYKEENEQAVNYAGNKDYKLSEVYEGLIRNIEYCSNAETAYDTAFEHAAGWGLGYFRITSEYADDDGFEQDLRIKRIRNYKSVLLDPDFQELDGSDARYGFLFTKLHKDEFDERYPNKERVSIEMAANDAYEIWADGDYVFIAEYYYVKTVNKTLYLLENGDVYDADPGEGVARTRNVKKKVVCWAKISGADILEEERETVFSHIPIIPVIGKELIVEGKPVYRGVIRHALDAQRMYNYSRTADVERTALVPKSPYIAADKQVEDYRNEWETANKTNRAVLRYKHIPGVPMPMRQAPVSTNPGETSQSMQASDDIKNTTGLHDASMGAQGNETSGRAIQARQREGDTANFGFTDNLNKSIAHAGRILVNAIPKIYDTPRVIRVRFPDNAEDFVEINKQVPDGLGGWATVHDITIGKYDVIVKAGPSYNTQRMEAMDAMTRILQANPNLWSVIGDLVAKNMEWPGADEFAKRLKKTIPPNLLDEADQEPAPPQPPSPADEAAMAESQAKMATAEANIAKAEATMAKAESDKALADAKLMEAIEKINNLDESIKEAVAETMAEAFLQYGVPTPQEPPEHPNF